MLRLFVALEVPEARRRALDVALVPLRSALPQARWADPAAWHVTLKFLGATPEERLAAVMDTVREVGRSTAATQSRLTELGTFPNARHARVLWAGVADPGGVLARLAAGLESAFCQQGYPTEQRPWRAHLTLARFREPARVEAVLARVPISIPPVPFDFSEMVLLRSHLRAQGAIYQALGAYPLGA